MSLNMFKDKCSLEHIYKLLGGGGVGGRSYASRIEQRALQVTSIFYVTGLPLTTLAAAVLLSLLPAHPASPLPAASPALYTVRLTSV